MTLSDKKRDLIFWITTIKNEALIQELQSFRERVEEHEFDNESSENEVWNTLSEDHQAAINRGLNDYKEGRTFTHDEVKKLYDRTV